MENQKNSFRIGPIRPPSEANSLLIQVTRGCTWNKCKFCGLYRHTDFKAYSADSVKEDIDTISRLSQKALKHKIGNTWDIEALNDELSKMDYESQNSYYTVINWLMYGGKNVFLQDGNTTVLKGGKLTDVLKYLKSALPSIERITSYGRAENLAKVTAEEFKELKEAGLSRIHSGFESGDNQVLKLINKGVTQEEEIIAGKNIKSGGIELSVYFMPGIGGKYLSEENALGMAHVISETNPDFVRIRSAAIKDGTELYEDFKKGDFVLCTEDQKVMEIRTLIEKSNFQGKIASDHIVNLLQTVEGKDKTKMLSIIDGYLGMEDIDRRVFQAGRRLGKFSTLDQLDRISSNEKQGLLDFSKGYDEEQWAIKMNELMGRFI